MDDEKGIQKAEPASVTRRAEAESAIARLIEKQFLVRGWPAGLGTTQLNCGMRAPVAGSTPWKDTGVG